MSDAEFPPIVSRFYEEIRVRARPEEVRVVGDVGCGGGHELRALADLLGLTAATKEFVGVDLLSQFPPEARPTSEGNLRFIDREGSEFDDLCRTGVDFLFSRFSLHHFEHPVGELRAMERMLRPGGVLFLFDFCSDFSTPQGVVAEFESAFSQFFQGMRGKHHRAHYSLSQALDLVSATGLEVVDSFEVFSDPGAWAPDGAEKIRSHHESMEEKILPTLGSEAGREAAQGYFGLMKHLMPRHGIDLCRVYGIVCRKVYG